MLEEIKRIIFKVAIYIRLSKEDVDKGYDESESITNQKALLTEYVEKLGWEYELVDIYIDPGYTGTNFNRPDFQRMIRDIEAGKVNMVITKDLSRLGRDYIETGEYVEKWFPEHEVRYVSITDGIDTFAKNNGNNDIAPFKSILNDMYSKDLSKKIKTAFSTMQKQGKWLSGKTPIGYIKDPNDKNHLVICEEEAEIVRTIFYMALAGNDVGTIRHYLVDNKIPTPNQLRYNKMTFWENRSIKNILRNEVYVGTTIQNKRSRISYKNRKIKINPKEQWNIVENTHEPIICRKDFDRVQKMVITQKYNRDEKKNIVLLDGLLFCYECKHKLGVNLRTRDNYFSTSCNNYRRNSSIKLCTSHGFGYAALEKEILDYIRNLFLAIDGKKIETNIKNNRTKYDYGKMLNKLEKEISLLHENIDNMYVDKLNKKISEEMYNRVFNKFTREIQEKEREYSELKSKKEEVIQEDKSEIERIVKEFLKLEHPTTEMLKVVVNRIEVHQDKQIDIIFNFKRLNDIANNVI